jgi:hypothetical protein
VCTSGGYWNTSVYDQCLVVLQNHQQCISGFCKTVIFHLCFRVSTHFDLYTTPSGEFVLSKILLFLVPGHPTRNCDKRIIGLVGNQCGTACGRFSAIFIVRLNPMQKTVNSQEPCIGIRISICCSCVMDRDKYAKPIPRLQSIPASTHLFSCEFF